MSKFKYSLLSSKFMKMLEDGHSRFFYKNSIGKRCVLMVDAMGLDISDYRVYDYTGNYNPSPEMLYKISRKKTLGYISMIDDEDIKNWVK